MEKILQPEINNIQNRTFGVNEPHCPVCASNNHKFIRSVFDDRYGCPDMFSIVSCNDCGHLMTSPVVDEKDLGDLYGKYYPRKYVNTTDLVTSAAEVIRPWSRFQRWWNGTNNQGQYSVSTGQVMLDVGCGNGLSLLEAQELGAQAYGIEADPNVERIADELKLRVHIGSIYDRPFPEINFDLIVLNQVIEHIPDPSKTLKTLKERLKPMGRIVIVFPNRNSFWQLIFRRNWINWHIPYHLHHFNYKGFKTFAEQNGYRVIRKMTITPTIWTVLQLQAVQQFAVPGRTSSIWKVKSDSECSTSNLIPKEKKKTKRIMRKLARVAAFFVLGLFNRILDAVSLGDSILVELEIESSR
jgi:2-polyprenyl-3-methyl-5-hydroxy-6-metoxy-1,4-benzoquinol methylase